MTSSRSTPSEGEVRVDEFRFEYPDGSVALEDLSLDVPSGEVLGLLGPNGCGKTTLLRAIARSAHAADAAISLATTIRPALALDTPVFHEWLSGRENAATLLSLRGSPRAEAARRADAAIERFGLEEAAARPVTSYSRGTRHRLGLAIAFATDAKLLLLDEPLGGLDPAARERLAEEVRAAAEGGRTVLFSTHDPEFAAAQSDRVGFLARGRLLALDRPAAFLAMISGGARIRVRFAPDGAPGEATYDRLPDGVTLATTEGDSATFTSPDPAASLPGLLARLFAAGARVSAVEIREPSLREAYFVVTGEALTVSGGGDA